MKTRLRSLTNPNSWINGKPFFRAYAVWRICLGLLVVAGLATCTRLANEVVAPKTSLAEARVTADKPIVLGYFPSWSETWLTNGVSKLTSLPGHITHVFLAFGKPNLRYTKGSYDLTQTGIQVPYDGQMLRQAIAGLAQKGTKVMLSLGGETYWATPDAYAINFGQIKDLVDDMGFAGIDWDFEPNGSFQDIGSPANINHFIDFLTQSRAMMPRSSGYIIACAPAGVGALGGPTNDEASSRYAYAKRNTLTGEADTYLYAFTDGQHSISLFGFSSTGHMIPVFKAAGSTLDLVAFQGYNVGAAKDRTLMYNAYAYYANTYGFKLAAGTHVPNEPWGPYYTYSAQASANLAQYIYNGGAENRAGKGDGLMVWNLLLSSALGSDANYTGVTYLNVASKVLNGTTPQAAIAAAFDYATTSPPATVAAPTVASTTATVGATISGQVSVTGTLLVFKEGTLLATLPLSSTTWRYSPTATGSYSFKLQTAGGTSAASATVVVTLGSTGGSGGCGYAAYDPTQAYPTAGTYVYYASKIYQNQWYANPGEVPDDTQPWGNWKFVQTCTGSGSPVAPAAPSVTTTTGKVGSAITGQTVSVGTLIVFKDGLQLTNIALNSTSWSYAPLAGGSYTFKLQTAGGTSAASVAVIVPGGNPGGSGGCGYSAYVVTNAYPTPGSRVFYNNKIYESKWYINPGEAPDDTQPWGGWKFVQVCQ